MPRLQASKFIVLLTPLLLFVQFVGAADQTAGQKKAIFCQGCHGNNGNSKSPMYPILAGQHAKYIEKQLKAFKSEQRKNMMMKGVASQLSEQDISNMAAFFSSQTTESAGNGDPELAKAGKQKFAMCSGCHGANALGRNGFPKLAGQQPKYLEKQLLSFKDRSRKGGPMNAIASSLSEQDIKEITAYLGNL